MAQITCSGCRLRFGRHPAVIVALCPNCGQALESIGSSATVGYRLYDLADTVPALPVAAESALLAAVNVFLEDR